MTQEGTRQFIQCKPLPANILGPDHSARATAAKIEVVELPKVNNVDELIAFMKNERDGKHPRYREYPVGNLLKMLKTVETAVSFATIYDLSSLDLDPREPNSPDIFIIMKKSGAIWLKDAKHLQFDWNKGQRCTDHVLDFCP